MELTRRLLPPHLLIISLVEMLPDDIAARWLVTEAMVMVMAMVMVSKLWMLKCECGKSGWEDAA